MHGVNVNGCLMHVQHTVSNGQVFQQTIVATGGHVLLRHSGR